MANIDLCRTCCQLKFGFEEIFANFPNQIAHILQTKSHLNQTPKKLNNTLEKRVKKLSMLVFAGRVVD